MSAPHSALRLLSCASCVAGLVAAEHPAARGDLLCEADGGCQPDAALGLLQLAKQPQPQRPQPLAYTRFLQAGQAKAVEDGDCEKYPTLCGEPFNCFKDPPGPADMLQNMFVHMATDDGHANLRSWCSTPEWDTTLAKYCIATPDLVKSAHVVYEKQVRDGAAQADGSYCFLEGHCVNPDVTPNTTLAEAEALCDKKYTHEGWTTLAASHVPLAIPPGKNEGFKDRAWSTYFGKMACAMGNYHCDVIYCKETYCKMPEYRSKYEHFLKEYGWA